MKLLSHHRDLLFLRGAIPRFGRGLQLVCHYVELRKLRLRSQPLCGSMVAEPRPCHVHPLCASCDPQTSEPPWRDSAAVMCCRSLGAVV
jgi:hypothetical protein